MFSKILGAAALITASFFIGKNFTDKLKKRKNSLNLFHTALVMLESEINFSANNIACAFSNISESVHIPGVFEYVISETENIGIRNAWNNAILKFKDKLCLTDNDVKILKTLSAELGITDKENQIKNIRYILTMLQAAEADAHEKYCSLSGLYKNISLCAGIAAAILLM